MIPRSVLQLFIILFSAALAVPAAARLWETKEECAARYGEPIRDYEKEVPADGTPAKWASFFPGGVPAVYKREQVIIYIEFVNGRAIYIRFRDRSLNPVECEQLLQRNRGDVRWAGPEEYGGRSFWIGKSADGKDIRHGSYYEIGGERFFAIAADEAIRSAHAEAVGLAKQAITNPAVAPAAPAAPAAPGTTPATGGAKRFEGF